MTDWIRLPGTPDPMHRVKLASGMEIAADSWGPPGSRLVLLQHGGGQTRHAWKGTGEGLAAAGYHAVAFDARGHGDSGWDPDADYTQRAMVADLLGVMAHFGDDHPVLVGASMGGGTSLVAIGEGAVDAAALVLVDVAPKVEPEGVENIREFMYGKPGGFESLEEVAAAIGAYQPHRSVPKNLQGLAKNVRLAEDGRFHWHWDPRIPFASNEMEARQALFEACARRLVQPTLLVRGGLSDVLSEEGAQDFLCLCPHAEYVNVRGAAHMVAGDRNDIFAKAVVEFLVRCVPVTGDLPTSTVEPSESAVAVTDGIVDIP